jgi:cytoskeletal protein CcmA (bactofilin family)
MADVTTVISRSAHVRGRVSGDSNLEIHGRVDGEVDVTGELVVDTHALVAANLTARRLIIRGAVKGDLTAVEGVVLEDGARVVGDVRAPRISIAPGALLRGYVQTAAGGAAAPRAKAQTQHAAPRTQPKAVVVSASRAAPPPARPQPVAVAVAAKKPVVAAVKAGPPAPVVPALRKGAKGALHKKRAS